MKVNKYLALILLIILSLSIVGCANSAKQNTNHNKISFDFEPYKDLATMKKDAGMVFLGTVTTVYPAEEQVIGYSGKEYAEPHYAPFTVSEIKVDDVIKGDINIGDSVKVRQLGGVIDGEAPYCENVTLLSEGEQGIFFTDSVIVDKNSPPSILVLDQGILKIEDGMIKVNEFQKELIESSEISELTQHLKQII